MEEDWRKEAKQRIKDKGEGSRFKLQPGDNCFRILPNSKGTQYPPHLEILIHRDVGPDKKAVRCGKEINDSSGECWLCDEKIPALEASKKASHKVTAKALQSKEQMLVQVSRVDPDTNNFSAPKVWWVSTGGPKSQSVALLGTLASTKRQYDDPKRGYNLNISRTGTGPTDTRYGSIIPDEEPTKVPSSVLNGMKSLASQVDAYDEDVQRAAYYGRDLEEVQNSRKESTDMPKSKKKDEEVKKKKKPVVEEPEELDEDDEDEDEEETPKSKKSKKAAPVKKSKKVVDEDDDEDEDDEDDEDEDDEDDEDEAPAKKSKKSAPAKKSKKVADDDDDDEDDEDEDDEDEDEDEDDDDEDDEADEDDDDEDDDDDDDDEDDDDEEDEKPSKKSKSKVVTKGAKSKKVEAPAKKSKKVEAPVKKSKKVEPPAKKKKKK